MVMTLQKALEVDFLDEEFSRLTKPQDVIKNSSSRLH